MTDFIPSFPTQPHSTEIKIAVIGDIHEQWELTDNLILQELGIDLALFVGDLGNESVAIARLISELEIPKAVILGNHDAWYTASDWGRKKSPYDHRQEDWVTEQLTLLGEAHVGYGKLDLPQFQLSIVGGRPFSWGGSEWKNHEFFRDRYDIRNFAESEARMIKNLQEATYETVIFLGHNGPLGLGNEAEAICGRDWQPLGGDHGDPDFAQAIAAGQTMGKHIPLVTFGHMHHSLRHTKSRLRTRVTQDQRGTIYLNAAAVPRIINHNRDRHHNFSLVTLENHQVTDISLIWVNQDFRIVHEDRLYAQYAKI